MRKNPVCPSERSCGRMLHRLQTPSEGVQGVHYSEGDGIAMKSNREKKREIKEGVDRLKSKPGWDPGEFSSQSPGDSLRDVDQAMRTEQTYEKSCDACKNQQIKQNDPTALCEKHLQEILGFG